MSGRMIRGRIVVAALLSMAWVPSFAGVFEPEYYEEHWVLIPGQPTTRDFVILRNVHSGCRGWGTGARELAFHEDGTIDFYIADTSDICELPYLYDAIIDTHLGYLPAGDYTVRFIECGVPYDPEFPGCTPSNKAPVTFSVTEAGLPRHVIPTLADSVKLALAAVLAFAGLALLRTRR